ncbi:MAG TPA: regulatory protein RecX [Gammaproteobacteria bacterium]
MADELTLVRKAAYTLLARREYGRQEMVNKLLGKGFDSALIDSVVELLMAERLLSDERFVDAFVRSRSNRGYGPRRIEAELRERGISDELSDERIAAGPSEEETDWVARAAEVRCKKFGEELPSDFQERAKQMRYLEYRGFTHEQIRRVFKGNND